MQRISIKCVIIERAINFYEKLNTRLCFRLLGVDKLFSYAINEWLNDIKTNQLQGLLSGVAPIHTLVKLGEYNTSSRSSTCSLIILTFNANVLLVYLNLLLFKYFYTAHLKICVYKITKILFMYYVKHNWG